MMIEKIFTLEDQKTFAKLSGDYNPIHLSPIEARRTITGQCIVHGIHLFLWVLELLAKSENINYGKYRMKFIRPVTLNEIYNIEFENNFSQIYIKRNNIIYSRLEIEKNDINYKTIDNINLPLKSTNKIPNEIEQKEVYKSKKLEDSFYGKKELCKILFKNLSIKFGDGLICQICSLSEIIGMRLPGLNSLFSKAEIEIGNENYTNSVQIANFDSRSKKVIIKCDYRNLSAKLEAFFRPSPVQNLNCKDIKNKYRLDMKGVKALIIGGSRGIGECVAKLLAVGGAESVITFNSGKVDADKIIKDIKEWGSKSEVINLNINENEINLKDIEGINQVYYFASPRIEINRSPVFDKLLYDKYYQFYVKGLTKVIESLDIEMLQSIFFPSTIFIESKNQLFKEYIKAKEEGEINCEYIKNKYGIRIIKPRLPVLLTDQTISILPRKTKNIYTTIIPYLEKM